MRFEENVKIYEKYDKIDDIPYGSQVELKVGDRNYIIGTYQGLCGGFAIDISGHTYSLSQIQEIKVNTVKEEKFKLGDIVEVTNIDGLNRVLYNDFPKGGKELIGLQGKITIIDKITCKNITYYLVDLPNAKYYKIKKQNCIEDGSHVVFLEENLKLVKEEESVEMNKKEDEIYLEKDIGIRKDYLYKITIEDVGAITGEILNFNGCTYVIKSYKDTEFNHYIVKYKNILDLHPVMTIEQYNKKVLKL
jgi:hypothetical protein